MIALLSDLSTVRCLSSSVSLSSLAAPAPSEFTDEFAPPTAREVWVRERQSERSSAGVGLRPDGGGRGAGGDGRGAGQKTNGAESKCMGALTLPLHLSTATGPTTATARAPSTAYLPPP
eukprot:CAMPEP_0119477260 /NCGR_PEP_ID=MMETSP1344-20130328/7473_1 /TAXON_ID=236787 /ORGANISM="Florenciella parvula, Strain CCMP2471" /LENGTH=118 /DNA_ID=CAMNT_0007511223 /DNA_START=628 /DNA_END=982 /DNA_ORIENTATION=-